MAQNQYTQQYNSSYGANTTNLGARLPGAGQNGVMWDPDWQKTPAPPANLANTGYFNPSRGTPSSQFQGGNQYMSGGANLGASGGVGGAYSIANLIAEQRKQNDTARAQSEATWQEGKNGMLGVASQYAGDPNVGATNSLVSRLLSNPESLNDRVVQDIQNQNQNNIRAQTDNQYRQLRGGLSAAGQSDASTLEAMRERLFRSGMAQSTAATTNLGIERAKARTGDIINAANLGRMNSAANIAVPMGVHSAILNNLPQYKPDDLTGLGGLAVAEQAGKDRAAALRMQYDGLHGGEDAGDAFQFTQPKGGEVIGAGSKSTALNNRQNDDDLIQWQSGFAGQNSRPLFKI